MWVSRGTWFLHAQEVDELTTEIDRLGAKANRMEGDVEYYKQKYYRAMQDYIDLMKDVETAGINPVKLRKYAAAKKHHDELHSVVLSIPEEVSAQPEPEPEE